MYKHKQYHFWAPFSVLIALTGNINRDPKKQKAIDSEDVNPFSEKKNTKVIKDTKTGMKMMKHFFINSKGKKN